MMFWKFKILEKCPGPIFQKPTKYGVWENPVLSRSKFPLLAIHIFSHIWEDRSRKVNNDEPDLGFFHGNFWPVISQAVRNPCFSTSIPRGPNLCILDFQTPDEFSNPDPGPSQRTQGWNTSARKPSLLTSSNTLFSSQEGPIKLSKWWNEYQRQLTAKSMWQTVLGCIYSASPPLLIDSPSRLDSSTGCPYAFEGKSGTI